MKTTDSVKRVDAEEKIKGQARYIEDIPFENLHFARTLRSTVAKGRILSIDYPEGFDDILVVDAADCIKHNAVAMIETDMPIFAETEVNYVGEPIALIVGKDKNRIVAFMNGIRIEYETGKAVFTLDQSPLFTEKFFTKGDLSTLDGLQVVSETYETPYQEHMYMEKQGIVAQYVDGRIEVYGSMQCPYYIMNALTHALGFPRERLRVVQTTTGGAFGGKEDYPSLLACQAAMAAIKAQAPVRIVFDRREDIQFTTKRHPARIAISSWLDGSRILGMKIDVDLDAGPYLGLSDVVLQRAILTMTGAYQIPHLEIGGRTHRTNNVFTGAFRGFGAPQSLFALESHMTHLAKRLEIDPVEFRRAHYIEQGQATSTGGIFREPVDLHGMTDRLLALSGYDRRSYDADRLVGYGFVMVPHGGGFTGDGEANHIKAVVRLDKDADHRVHVRVSNVEMGQGARTALSKIVAITLDIPMERVLYENPDTDLVPDSGPTAASRTTMVVGRLLRDAAMALKPWMDSDEEKSITQHYHHPDNLEWDQDLLRGNAYLSYSWAALLARVEVDPLTYAVQCTDLYGVYDVGVPIDETLLLGQVHGGIAQGLGYGIMEAMDSKDGLIQHSAFSSYAIPTAADIPRMHTAWFINPYQEGPFGAKAAGELTLVGVAPALAAAVSDAIGADLHRIPILPETILEVLGS